MAWLTLAGCAGAPLPPSYVGPAVSPAEENRALALFHDRADQLRQAADRRVRAVGVRLLAVMGLARPAPFELLDSNDVNAYTRGGTVRVTLGMIRFAQNDHELALVLGHELGHLMVDAQVQAGHLTPEDRERVADYHGLVGLHRAGYDIVAACEIWQRMATELALHPAGAEVPGHLGWMATHPSFAERYVRAHKLAESLLGAGLPSTPPPERTGVPAVAGPAQRPR